MANNNGGFSEPAAPACLLVLCGLPGSGKSTLCRHMIDSAPKGINAFHLCFDEVEAELTPLAQGQGLPAERTDCGTESSFDSGRWRQARRISFQRLREMLSRPHDSDRMGDEQRRIVLVDDNMHYRSMRRQCYRLARDCRSAYAGLHVTCSLEEALRRNESRHGTSRLSPELILKMDTVMEVPGGHDAASPSVEFGQPVIRFSTSEKRDHAGQSDSMCSCSGGDSSMADEDKVRKLWANIIAAWGAPPHEPLLGPEAREQLRAAGQAGNAASAAHALDLRCRTAIGAVVALLAGRGCSGAARGRAAGRLNEARKRVIEACRAASHHRQQQQQQPSYEEDELMRSDGGGWMERLESEEAVFGDLCEELLGCPEAAL